MLRLALVSSILALLVHVAGCCCCGATDGPLPSGGGGGFLTQASATRAELPPAPSAVDAMAR